MLLSFQIHDVKHITGDTWLVIYYESLPCMCRSERKDIIIKSKEKPQEDEIINRIKGIRS